MTLWKLWSQLLQTTPSKNKLAMCLIGEKSSSACDPGYEHTKVIDSFSLIICANYKFSIQIGDNLSIFGSMN